MAVKRRQSDGITYNKIVVGLVASMFSTVMGLLVYIYSTDQARAEKYQNEITVRIEKTEIQVQEIKTQNIVSYSHQVNLDARIEKFIKESRNYWRKNQ